MYKKAFELSYKNKKVEIEIQDFVGDVRNINGTEDLFSLSYISDSKDKGQSILVTEADINFYADDYFNIDELKTVGETDIKVKYYENDSLLWSGFVIPDFFSTSVDIAPVVSMVATDRVGTLKEISNNAESNIPIQILASCLKQTGQDLPINLIADNNHFETPIQLERIDEIASYDVIRTFMVLFNCKITLYKNAWWIINKKLLESGFINYKSYNSDGAGGSVTPFAQPILDIDLVDRDGQREIKPTASEISLFLEFGGSKKYPKNWDFEKWNGATFDNWTNHNGFSQGKRQTEIIFYTRIDGYYQVYLSEIETENKSLWYVARWYSNKLSDNILDYPNLKSSSVNVPKERGFIDIALNGNFTTRDGMPIWIVPLIHNKTNGNYFTYNKEGVILKIGSGTPNLNQSNFDYVHNPRASSQNGFNPDDMTHASVDVNWDIKNTFDLRDFGSDSDEIEMQVVFLGGIYSQGSLDYGTDVFLNSVNISFNDSQVTGKGLIFKIKQGGEKFSKSREPETILFSDKINQGVNGYFYNYKYDDTSIVDLPSEFALSSVRERADMFSKARDYYSLDGNFIVNPLAKYKCGLKSFVLVGGENRREDASIIIEEIVSSPLNKTDFIYTYFDDGKDKVKSIGTASGGSSSGGGGGGGATDVNSHTHPNKIILDTITQEMLDNALREMLGVESTEEITDENYFSALRTLKEILDNNEVLKDLFLSKTNNDTARGFIQFLQGISVKELATLTQGLKIGDYQSGMHTGQGGAIDSAGNAELESLVLRSFLEVPSIRYNELEYIGEEIIIGAGAVLKGVEHLGGARYRLTLKLEDGQLNPFRPSDLLKGIYNMDENGNFTGFGTTYVSVSSIDEHEMIVILADESDVVANRNMPPRKFMHLARIGNFIDEDRQSYISLSAKDRAITQYGGVNAFAKKNKQGKNVRAGVVTTQWGRAEGLEFIENFENLPITKDSDVLYTDTLLYNKQIKVDYKGIVIKEYIDRGQWFEGMECQVTETTIDEVWIEAEKFRLIDRPIVGDPFTTIEKPTRESEDWMLILSFKEEIEGSRGSVTFFAKPDKYKKGDRWILTEDTQLLNNFYKKGQILEAAYTTNNDSDWRLMLIEGDEEATEGINLIRNYDFREGLVHWGAIEGSIVELEDELPTEFYTPSINVIGDEYGYEYAITSENDELIIFDE